MYEHVVVEAYSFSMGWTEGGKGFGVHDASETVQLFVCHRHLAFFSQRYPLAIKRGRGNPQQMEVFMGKYGKIIKHGGFSIATFDGRKLSTA